MHSSNFAHAKEVFNTFRVESVWVQSIYDTTQALFSSGTDITDLLQRCAAHFFADLNHILIEYWVLVVARITDPAKTMGRENVTAKLILEMLDELGLLTVEIQSESDGLHRYRAILNDARNRVVSHADKQTFLNPTLLGMHAPHDITEFLTHLQKFNDLVGEALEEGPLDFQSTYGPGDVFDLIRALKSAA